MVFLLPLFPYITIRVSGKMLWDNVNTLFLVILLPINFYHSCFKQLLPYGSCQTVILILFLHLFMDTYLRKIFPCLYIYLSICHLHGLMDSFHELHSITIITYYVSENSRCEQRAPSPFGSFDFCYHPNFFLSNFLLSDITKHSSPILYFMCPNPGINHFFKEWPSFWWSHIGRENRR